MISDAWMAKFTGIAFLVVAVTTLVSFYLSNAIFEASDVLVAIAENPLRLRISIFLDLISSAGIIPLAVLLYVKLREYNHVVALLGLGWWLAEAIILAVSKISLLTLLTLSQKYVAPGSGETFLVDALADVLVGSGRWGYTVILLFFGLGGLMFYSLYYTSRVIPRSLSQWGLVAVLLVLVGGVLFIFGMEPGIFLFLPNILFELTLCVWLLLKGFGLP